MSTRVHAGYTLLETLLAVTVALIVSAMTLPNLLRLSSGQRVRLAASELASTLRLARAWAVRNGANVAVRFSVATGGENDGFDRVSYRLYGDGDGDGVLTRDIESGVDPPLGPSRQLIHVGRHVRFGIPQGPPPRDPGDPRRRLRNLQDPIRFNRSDLASFNPLGGSTPGSLYLTDGHDHLAVVRVSGRTGRVRVLIYDFVRELWR